MVERPASVQTAFEVFEGKNDTGPHATAMFAYIRDLERALAERAGGVKVKALEWDDDYAFVPEWGAQTSFDWAYRITSTGRAFRLDGTDYDTLEAAKAAAQADYERRILSALTTEPAAPEAEKQSGRTVSVLLDEKGYYRGTIASSGRAGYESSHAAPKVHGENSTAPEGRQCDRCQGNGEIVTDWDRYRHPHDGDVGDEAVAECPDCNGEGVIADHRAPEGRQEAAAWPRGTRIRVEHDGFEGVVLDPYTTLEGKRGQVCQLAGARVVHVYGEKWLQRADGDATRPAEQAVTEAAGAIARLLTYGEAKDDPKGTLFRFDNGARFFLSKADTDALTAALAQNEDGR